MKNDFYFYMNIKHTTVHFTLSVFLVGIILYFVVIDDAFGEKQTVTIPFGAYNPELNTPAEVWYDPPVIAIKVGDSVTWQNDDREGHTVTSGQGSGRFGWMGDDFGQADGIFDSGRFLPGNSWSYMFDDEGTYRYYYNIHPWMEGTIIVEPIIPSYPHDALGNKIEQFPVIEYTADGIIELESLGVVLKNKTNENGKVFQSEN